MLTRRTALALPAALSLAAPVLAHPFAKDGRPWWLKCFLPDKIPPGVNAVYDVNPDMRAFVLGSSEGYQTADNIYYHRDPRKRVKVPPIMDTDAAFEGAAGAMLSSALDETRYDFTHNHHRHVDGPGGVRLSVDEPFWLGRLCLFSDGSRGLLLFNPAAVVAV